MDLGDGLGHLTYSTLVHPGDTWQEMRESVAAHVPAVKRASRPDGRWVCRCGCPAPRSAP